jgi:hypothetical protein
MGEFLLLLVVVLDLARGRARFCSWSCSILLVSTSAKSGPFGSP